MARLSPIAIILLSVLCTGFAWAYFYDPAVEITFLAFGVAALLIAVDFFTIPGKNGFELEREIPAKLSLGDENEVFIHFHNRTRQLLRGELVENFVPGLPALHDGQFMLHVPANASERFRYVLVPRERGAYEFTEISVKLVGRFRLLHRTWNVPVPGNTKVYPSYLQLRNTQVMSRKWNLSQIGQRNLNRYGEGREFESLREYSVNDEYRKINWKATARRGKPIVSQYQIERNQNIILMVDAGRMMRPLSGHLSKLDHAVNAALMLSFICLHKEDNVGLMVFNSKVTQFVPPHRGKSQLHRINEALYNVQFEFSEPNYTEAFYYLRRKVSRRSLVVLLTDVMDERASQILISEFSKLFPRHLPLFVTLKDNLVENIATQVPGSLTQMLEMGVAQLIVEERLKAMHRLRLAGVHTLDTQPEKLSVDAINKYLEIKSKSLL